MPRSDKLAMHKSIQQSFLKKFLAALPEKASSIKEKYQNLIYLCLLGLGFCLVLASFPNHSWMFPAFVYKHIPQSLFLLFGLWIGIVVVLKRFPPSPKRFADLSPKLTRLFLFLILVLALFSRFHFSERPFGTQWGDSYFEVKVAQSIFDTKNYCGDAFVFTRGYGDHGVLPLGMWPYILLWGFWPTLKAITMHRLVCSLVYALAIFFLFLAGKEAANRRVGLFVAALALVSKPLLQKSLMGAQMGAPVMLIALILWLFFRTVKRPPHLGNFMALGAAVGLIPYCYSPFRILIPFFLFAALAWILFEGKKKQLMDLKMGILVGGTAFLFLFYIYYVHILFIKNAWLMMMLDVSGPWLPCMVFAVLLAVFFFSVPRLLLENRFPALAGWLASAWLCMIVSFPMLTHPFIQGLLAKETAQFPIRMQFIETLRFLFERSLLDGLRNDLEFTSDCFFGYPEIILGAFGLALAIARSNKIRFFLLCAFAAGCCPFMFTNEPHSLRLMACVPPLFLMAGLALEQFWARLTARFPGRGARILLAVFLAGFWVWSGWATYHRVIVQWARGEKMIGKEMAVFNRVEQDHRQGYRVYFSEILFTQPNPITPDGIATLYEGRPIYHLLQSNPIYLGANESPRDVVVYLFANRSWQDDYPQRTTVSDAYPNAAWEDVMGLYSFLLYDPEGVAWRCQIPAAEIQSRSSKLFKFLTAPAPCWKRTFYNAAFGLRLSYLDAEDCVTDPAAPVPEGFNLGYRAVQFNGRIQVGQKGKFEISCTTSQLTHVRIDGKQIFRFDFPITPHYLQNTREKSGKRTIYLSSGEHQVEVITYLQDPVYLPLVQLGRQGEAFRSLWTSFQY